MSSSSWIVARAASASMNESLGEVIVLAGVVMVVQSGDLQSGGDGKVRSARRRKAGETRRRILATSFWHLPPPHQDNDTTVKRLATVILKGRELKQRAQVQGGGGKGRLAFHPF